MNLKTFEKFSGKIKHTNPEDLTTEEVVDLVSLLFELKPIIPDEFPKMELSKLIRNEVIYSSDDDRFNIKVGFSENDNYIDKNGEIVTGKYKTIFKIGLSIKEHEKFKISEIKDYILLTSQLIDKTYEKTKILVDIENEKITIEEFEKISNNKKVSEATLLIKIY